MPSSTRISVERHASRVQQRSGRFQVGGLKPLGEPAVDLSQQPSGLVSTALPLPQLAQAVGRKVARVRITPEGCG